jgi:hypothetical protein
MTRASSFLTFAFCLLACDFLSAQQPRDARSGAAGAGSLSGILLTEEPSPRPVPRARIELSIEGQPARTAFSDAGGAFTFRGLPAGRYLLAASKPAYVRASYGAKRAGRPGTPITIADGQQISGITLRMLKGSVITGTVRDELGQPAPGVGVRLMQYRLQNGERTLVPAALNAGPLEDTTDDLGAYRLFGLAPGEYVLMATARPIGPGEIRMTTAQQAAPAPTVTYAPVFYPGALSAADAVPIVVGAGEERSGVDLPLQLVRTARIEGVVAAPNGAGPLPDVLMVPSEPLMAGPPTLSFNRARPDADGRFFFSGLAPGTYTVSARMPSGPFWASADVTVDGENVSGVSLNLQPGLTISGRVVLEGTRAAPPDLSSVRVSLTPGASGMTLVGAKDGTEGGVDAQGRFTLTNVAPGKYRLDAQMGANWTLKSAVVNGKDTLDSPVDVGPNDRASAAVLTFTDQSQEIAGTLQDAAGRPAPDFTIVVFPADRALWTAARRIRTCRPGTDGRFVVRGLPAGEYRIAALVDLAPGEATDPAVLDDLVPASVTLSLREGERKVQDLRMAGER